MKYIKLTLPFIGIILILFSIKFLFFNSPYLASLNSEEDRLYRSVMKTQDISILKDNTPEVSLKLFLHALKISDYETAYFFTESSATKEQFVAENREGNLAVDLIREFRFVSSEFTYIGQTRGHVQIDKNKELLMLKANGIWKVQTPVFQ
ncbi:hypothetical protein ACQKIY_08000 [Bacillus mycoides]|uniref:hypothetical protein n=1 Tax=Bacillus mycoides TaxID=1405 RepID=UPI003CFF8F77